MRIISGGRWTLNGRWVVVADDNTIAFDPPGLYGDGYSLVERDLKLSGYGPPTDPEDRGTGGFDAFAGFMSLLECREWVRARDGS